MERFPLEHVDRLLPRETASVLGIGSAEWERLLAPGRTITHIPAEANPPPGPFDAIVVAELGGHTDRARLQRLRELLAPEGWLVVIAPAAMNLHRLAGALGGAEPSGGTSRAELGAALRGAGLDVAALGLVRDATIDPIPLPLDGRTAPVAAGRASLTNLSVAETEEAIATHVLAAARLPGPAPECSLIIPAGRPVPDLGPDAHRVEVVRVGAEGLNDAVRRARGRVLAFLDEATPDPGWLDAALGALKAPGASVAAVGCRVLDRQGAIDHAGLRFGAWSLPHRDLPYRFHRGLHGDDPRVLSAAAMPAVAGEGTVVVREAFVAASGLEDALSGDAAFADLCLRLRARGHTIRYEPAAVLRVDRDTARGTEPQPPPSFFRRWAGRLVPDDIAAAKADGTDHLVERARVYGPPKGPPSIVWTSTIFDRAGFSEEARSWIVGLDDAGIDVVANPLMWDPWSTKPPPEESARLQRLIHRAAPGSFIQVEHFWPYDWSWSPRAVLRVGRPMFETDLIPPSWVAGCNGADQIWVPSTFNVQTFVASGVDPAKVYPIKQGLMPWRYDLSVDPLRIGGASGFVFLSVFAWARRKGWDLLVRAYLDEFDHGEDVTLVLKIGPAYGRTVSEHRDELRGYVINGLGRDPADGPPILVLDIDPGPDGMQRLYRGADAYVMPSHGEGWGRPYMEAMAMGLPTIGTRWSGNLDFMNDENSYLIDCTVETLPIEAQAESPLLRGMRWAEPSMPHLRSLMRRVYEDRTEAREVGERARQHILDGFTQRHAVEAVLERLRASGIEPARRTSPTVRVAWEGPRQATSGMAIANRATGKELARRVDLTPLPSGVAGPPVEVHVRSEWPPNLKRPPQGRWVLAQPWEYGRVPKDWLAAIRDSVDEVWAPSAYVKECYVRSGADPSLIAIVPLGVDPSVFRPGLAPLPLPTPKPFRFLFVGGTIPRKGADLLVETYLSTFGPDDPVCLVVRDLGAGTYYAGQGLHEDLERLSRDPRAPSILYLGGDLADADMPALYAACDCLVHPYRGEGFGLPIVEAMACGLPVIVSGHGAALDFCDPSVAYLVPAPEVPIPGGLDDVDQDGDGWWAEPDREALAAAMRHVVAHPDDARALGARAAEKIRTRFTWEATARYAHARVEALTHPAPPDPDLSVCMIVRDEEPSLRASVESVEGFADQLVVVDTGSTDRTVDLAMELGAEVFAFPWRDDFAAARNEAMSHARGRWILMLDADMQMDPAAHDEIRRLIHGEDACYLLRHLNYMDASERPSVVEHVNLRLFPNRPSLRYKGRVHEQLVAAPGNDPLPIRTSQLVAHHDGYRSPERNLAKARRDLVILEAMALEAPDDPFTAYNLGITSHTIGDDDRAERELARCDELCDGSEIPSYLPFGIVMRAVALIELDRYEEGAGAARRAVAMEPELADAHATLASALVRLGDLDEAEKSYRRAIALADRPTAGITDRAAGSWKSMLGIAHVRMEQGRWTEAREMLERAKALAPPHRAIQDAIEEATRKESDWI